MVKDGIVEIFGERKPTGFVCGDVVKIVKGLDKDGQS